jgi:hypothetical protein
MSELRIPLTPDFSLHAGSLASQDGWLSITPPTPSLFSQLCGWLAQQPPVYVGVNHWVLSIGATALCLRWGSYLAVLLDESKPVEPRAGQPDVSLISDDEMCRINIEMSSNLAHLLALWQEDESALFRLLQQAYARLPMPQRRLPRQRAALEMQLMALLAPSDSPALQVLRETAVAHPHRALANLLGQMAFRNGPVETLHAGREHAYSLNHRRCNRRQASAVLRHTAEQLGGVLGSLPVWHPTWHDLIPWPEAAGRMVALLDYPRGWSFTANSASIRLPLA